MTINLEIKTNIVYDNDMKITQSEIARRTGYSARHINRIFKGKNPPSVKLAKKLESVTGILWTRWFENAPVSAPDTTKAPPAE